MANNKNQYKHKKKTTAKQQYQPAKIEPKSQPKPKPQITPKKKVKFKKGHAIAIAVCAVIVLGIVALIGYRSGWFPTKDKPIKGELKLEEYKPLDIDESTVVVTDEELEANIDNILNSEATSESVTEGITEEGDTIIIDYVGTYKETGEAFEGGTAQDQNLTLGSGMMIEGFEDGLIGQKIGSTVTLDLTFPEDYKAEELAGVAVQFDVTIKSKTLRHVPELTDAFVAEHSGEYLENAVSTVAEFKEAVKQRIYDGKLEEAIYSAVMEKAEVVKFDDELYNDVKNYVTSTMENNANMYGLDNETFAKAYGYESADDYVTQTADGYLKSAMVIDKIAQKEHIKWMPSEWKEYLQKYMAQNGYEGTSVAEFIVQVDPTWLMLYKNTSFKYEKVMDILKENIRFVKSSDTTPEDVEAETSGDNTTQDIIIDTDTNTDAEAPEDAEIIEINDTEE